MNPNSSMTKDGASERVLITGAGGFVGSHLTAALSATGREVIGVVRQAGEYQDLAKSARLVQVSSFEDVDMDQIRPDVVIHTAALAHRMDLVGDAAYPAYRSVNTDAALMFARKAASAGVKRFIFLSTAKVNGESTIGSQAFASDDIVQPTDPYARSKREAELGLHAIGGSTGMEYVVIRPPLVYGRGVKGNFKILADRVRKGTPLPLGAIHNRRSMVGVRNLSDFITRCMTHPDAADQTFMVSDGEPRSTADLVRMMADSMSVPSRLIPVPVPVLKGLAILTGKQAQLNRLIGDFVVDIGHNRDKLGWTPPRTLYEELDFLREERP